MKNAFVGAVFKRLRAIILKKMMKNISSLSSLLIALKKLELAGYKYEGSFHNTTIMCNTTNDYPMAMEPS